MLAVVLQQVAEQLDLFGHGFGFGTGLFVEHFQLLFLRGQRFGCACGALLQGGQFGLALVQAIADQHQLLQAIAVGVPGLAQRRQRRALFKLPGDALQAFGNLFLLVEQALNRALALSAGQFGLLLEIGAEAGVLDQAGEGALRFEGLAQQRRTVGVLVLRFGQRGMGAAQALFELRLALGQFLLLLRVLLNLRGQRRELSGEFGLAGELVPLRGQLLQARQLQAFAGQTVPMLLRAGAIVRWRSVARPATGAGP